MGCRLATVTASRPTEHITNVDVQHEVFCDHCGDLVVIDHFSYHFAVDEYLRDVGAEAVDHLLEERGGVAHGGPVAHGPHVAVKQRQAVVNCWLEIGMKVPEAVTGIDLVSDDWNHLSMQAFTTAETF